MGGFASGLASAAGKIMTEAADHLSLLKDNLRPVASILNRTPEGQAIHERIQQVYYPTVAKSIEEQGLSQLKAAKANPALPPVDTKALQINAAKTGRYALAGPKDAIITLAAKSIHKRDGILAAQSFSNAMALVLRDYSDTAPQFLNKEYVDQKSVGAISTLKKNIQDTGVPVDVKPSYIPRSPIEKAVTSAVYKAFTPFIAIPHTATVFNGLFGSDGVSFLKGLAAPIGKSLGQGIDDFHNLAQTGAFSESIMRDINEYNQYKATGHDSFTGSSAAYYVHKLFYQPGFSSLRDYTLLSGANTGKYTIENVARDFAKNPADKNLGWKLRQVGLNPSDVVNQQGQLNPNQLGTAIYRFMNEHYFLDNTLQRSMWMQGTPWGRVFGTFHSYVTRQAKLMYKANVSNIRNQGVTATMRNWAVAGLMFPAIGEGIKVVERGLRGQNTELEEDVKRISGSKGIEAGAETYLEALSHIGAFGVYAHVYRGALTHKLVESMAGPTISGPAQFAEDVAVGTQKTYSRLKKGQDSHFGKNFTPVGRDILFDTPYLNVLGQLIAHRAVPTSKEHPYRDDPARVALRKLRESQTKQNP